MSDQLQELLQRIHSEGVEKAKGEAKEILDAAQEKAILMINNAETEAEKILAAARKASEDIQKNTESDMKLSAQHTMSVVKQKITDVVLTRIIELPAKESFNQHQFLQELIIEVVKAWRENSDSIRMVLSESLQKQLNQWLDQTIPSVLGTKIKVEFNPLMKNGFAIEPVDGTYKLSFTDEDFINLFRSYLRPRTAKLLFEE